MLVGKKYLKMENVGWGGNMKLRVFIKHTRQLYDVVSMENIGDGKKPCWIPTYKCPDNKMELRLVDVDNFILERRDGGKWVIEQGEK